MGNASNYFSDDQDLVFNLRNYPWAELTSCMPFLSSDEAASLPDDAYAVLESIGMLAAKEFAPLANELSEQSPTLTNGVVQEAPLMRKMLQSLAELGAMGATVSPEWGGMGLPIVVGHAIMQLLGRVDVGLANVFAYSIGSAKISEQFNTDYDFSEIIAKIAAGQELGAMSLTEPQAGSDLSQIRTRATRSADGTWTLRGQKIWITCGHAQHHFVLARSSDEKSAQGLRGLSLFYVPAFRKDGSRNIEVTSLEKKIGHHPVVTAAIHYDDSSATLLGKEGEGFSLMLHIMNHARISTASLALGGSEQVLQVAKQYAQERQTMGKPIAEHPMIAEYLDDMEVTTQGVRALVFECVFHEDMEFRIRLQLKNASDDAKADLSKRLKYHSTQARMLTPLAKYFATEEFVRISRMAVQILGGVGYMKEYGLGRFHTDSLLPTIYEGTSQIQSLMVLKDRLKDVFRAPKKFVQEMAKVRYNLISELDPQQRKLLRIRQVYIQFVQAFILEALSDQMKTLARTSFMNLSTAWKNEWDPRKSLNFGLKHAERFTKVVSYMTTGEILLKRMEQAKTTEERDQRRDIANRFLQFYEVRSRNLLEELKNDTKISLSPIAFMPKIFSQASIKLRLGRGGE